MRRCGFTIIELLVVVGIVAVLAAILIPSVQFARESSRRIRCIANLKQLGMALSGYADLAGAYPPSASFPSALLPEIELEPLYLEIDYSEPEWYPSNIAAKNTRVVLFRCPTDVTAAGGRGTNYAANFGTGVQTYGYNGIVRPINGYAPIAESISSVYVISPASVMDGLSNTAAIAEILVGNDSREPRRIIRNTPIAVTAPTQLALFAAICENMSGAGPANLTGRGAKWMFGDLMYTGYTHVLTPNKNNCFNGTSVQEGAYTSSSNHPGGVNLVWGDGHASFVHEAVDPLVWHAFGSRDGGEAF